MKSVIRQLILILVSFLMPTIIFAAALEWKIIPSKSSITFTGMQNNAPISGRFNKFTGNIVFNSADLKNSKVQIIIDTNSIASSYDEVAAMLMNEDWFNVKRFPQAIFTANQFIQTGANTYQASGTLTIRDKTSPIQIDFTAEQLSHHQAQVTGKTILKRTAFNVGQGEWSDTRMVKDEVQVDFVVTVEKQ